MIDTSDKSSTQGQRRHSTTVASIANTFELVITGIILAFVFRAFVVEAFRIPTGSMAETLRGAHFHVRCNRCGYKFDVGGDYQLIAEPSCPSCGYYLDKELPVSMSNGDRILVLKCIYQFLEPKRWDVVVFKNPLEPSINYIKRLIAGPGETVELIDGDVYINGRIARKPPQVQEQLWMCVYDNDYQPSSYVKQSEEKKPPLDNKLWRQPFENEPGSQWSLNQENATVYRLDSPANELNTILFNSSVADDFRVKYAYNSGAEYRRRPVCSDLMVQFYVKSEQNNGQVGAQLSKYEMEYHGRVDLNGRMTLELTVEGQSVELESLEIEPLKAGRSSFFRFAVVDHELILQFGQHKLTRDLGRGADDAGDRSNQIKPHAKISGAGTLALSHIKICRDIYYTSDTAVRATEGKSFTLDEDEFFVCGDNSPFSHDGRAWVDSGIGNNGVRYRVGVVPRDYLMGKAFFLYWSDAFRPFANALPIIPNLSRLGFIAGGTNQEL